MPKLVLMDKVRLFGVSKNPGKNGLYRLKRLVGNAFNKVIDSSEIKDRLTALTNVLYDFEERCRWFEITGDMCDGNVFRIEIEHNKYVFIPRIIDQIDLGEGFYRFYILVNGECTEYQWVTAVSIWKAYLG